MFGFENLNDDELVASYPAFLAELKKRGIIHSRNIVGDLGEYLAIRHYSRTAGLPKLQAAPIGTTNVDALSRDGDRYTIKTTTGSVTGVFYGLPAKGSSQLPEKKFEFLIIVVLGADYTVKKIVELNWTQFLSHKKWHSRMTAWNLSINRAVIKDAKIIFDAKGPL